LYGFPSGFCFAEDFRVARFGKNPTMLSSAKFSELLFWKKAHEFTLQVYQVTKSFPPEERYGLTSQFRRAAVSIAANMAEGYTRTGVPDKLRFFNIALSSLEECRYYLILATDLGYGDLASMQELLDDSARLLNAYCRSIKQKKGGD
jgi:four helix bundle protein